jgi:hypothetical protein
MTYQRKTEDVWSVHVDYGYGYEEVCSGTRAEAKENLKDYQENVPESPSKLVKSRVSKNV